MAPYLKTSEQIDSIIKCFIQTINNITWPITKRKPSQDYIVK